jgi:hypothetical protein
MRNTVFVALCLCLLSVASWACRGNTVGVAPGIDGGLADASNFDSPFVHHFADGGGVDGSVGDTSRGASNEASSEASNEGSNEAGTDAASTFVVGGTVSGLAGTGLVLKNGSETLAISANGTFTFTTAMASGAAYDVSVSSQPSSPSQTCAITRGTGTLTTADVTDVAVACTTNHFTVGGSVIGLMGTGLVLEDNHGDDLPVGRSGPFTFPATIASGSPFAVTVKTQPVSPAQTCTVSGGAGTVGSGNVTSVAINCQTGVFTVGGQVSGLRGTVVLQNNGGDDLTINANGSFAFRTPLASGSLYAVTVRTQPNSPSQTCTVTSDTGTVGNAAATDVRIACVTDVFAVGGTVTGLSGTGFRLQNNGGDDLEIGRDGAFRFATPVASGSGYAVTVLTQPSSPSQTCTVTSGTGAVVSSNITNVTILCTTNDYTIGVAVTGLAGAGLVLQDNGGDNLSITSNGRFRFPSDLASGATYAVTILSLPTSPTQMCTVSGGSGRVVAANITSVTVTCTTPVVCTTTVTSVLNETSPYGTSISVSYSMVGGGGGAGGGAGYWANGGGGGSSAILAGGSIVNYASGGTGGAEGDPVTPGTSGTTASGSFTLSASANLTVYVGGAGGGGGWDFGSGGGSGYFGGGGGADLRVQGPSGGVGGSNVGGAGINGATSGSSLAGGSSQRVAGGRGGIAGTGGAGGNRWDGGGGGGGFGGGGGACFNDGSSLPSAGGSNGASANNVATSIGGLGASTWASSTTLPAAAGAGGSTDGQGGNAGLVILTYTPPNGTCSL